MPNASTPATPTNRQPLFQLGRCVITPGAQEAIERIHSGLKGAVMPGVLLGRHVRGDWGDISEEDQQANAEALVSGARIVSGYTLREGDQELRIWVITDGDDDAGRRHRTTILLPSEY